MKKVIVLIGLIATAACSSTRHGNDTNATKHMPERSAYADASSANNDQYYASTKRALSPGAAQPAPASNEVDMEQRTDRAQAEMFKKIEMDHAKSLKALKKSMETKVYTTTTIAASDDEAKPETVVKSDTLYSVGSGGGWVDIK